MKCTKCQQAFNKPEFWDGFCLICEERIGMLLYQFIVHSVDGKLHPSEILELYIKFSHYNEDKIQPHKINEFICSDGATYLCDNYASISAFRYGWLASENYILNNISPQRINLEGIIQLN